MSTMTMNGSKMMSLMIVNRLLRKILTTSNRNPTLDLDSNSQDRQTSLGPLLMLESLKV